MRRERIAAQKEENEQLRRIAEAFERICVVD